MDYQKQIESFASYFKEAESKKENHKVGMEFEHLILKENLTAVKYSEEQGIESLLKQLSKGNWEKVFEGENLIGLTDKQRAVTLEPGGQLELSIIPFVDLEQTKEIYLSFIEEIKEILNSRSQKLAVLGYQPESSIKDLPLLPKKRYDLMYRYFKGTGKYAHNMMKGTASVQMNIDYVNELDYIKKFRVGYFLTPLVYYLFDNTPFFEGKTAASSSIRETIWANCDSERSGIIKGVFDKEFGYRDYAEYILNTPAIINLEEGNLAYSGSTKIKELMENDKAETIDHFLSMVFPDIRTKKYIEIRSADALPYPYNFAFAALLKAIFYNQDNLDYYYQQSLNYNQQEFLQFKNKVINSQENQKLESLTTELFKRAEKVAAPAELEYIKEFKNLYLNYGRPKFKTLNNIQQGKKKALSWCILN
ncbi:glutamate-cysteine ligase family protein [Halanaerobium sp. ST460_2HS_T2]|uniref:glutamate-cysteine ligase family protein n=1 Tax=Halanaerobium sp. ST460_2HS_T2 TaxID=2183914 RepID=UPI000DF3A6BC|nr:glutamate-cysteine ligase family protein [Halanaerobium sp. ST460_2HS_T2]RCW57354.1 glutamate--cysteine ligase [Halanaerobium sp. ST460_2HS_T2]